MGKRGFKRLRSRSGLFSWPPLPCEPPRPRVRGHCGLSLPPPHALEEGRGPDGPPRSPLSSSRRASSSHPLSRTKGAGRKMLHGVALAWPSSIFPRPPIPPHPSTHPLLTPGPNVGSLWPRSLSICLPEVYRRRRPFTDCGLRATAGQGRRWAAWFVEPPLGQDRRASSSVGRPREGRRLLGLAPSHNDQGLTHPDEMSRRPSNLPHTTPQPHTQRDRGPEARRGEAVRGGGGGGGEPTPGTRLHAHYRLCTGPPWDTSRPPSHLVHGYTHTNLIHTHSNY